MTKYLYTVLVRDKEIEEDKPEPSLNVQKAWKSMVVHPSELTNVTSLPHLRHTRLVFHAQDSYDATSIIADLLYAVPDNHERIIHYESIEEVNDD